MQRFLIVLYLRAFKSSCSDELTMEKVFETASNKITWAPNWFAVDLPSP